MANDKSFRLKKKRAILTEVGLTHNNGIDFDRNGQCLS